MPRGLINIVQLKAGSGDGRSAGNETTGVPADDHYWLHATGDLLVVRNADSGNAHTVDVQAVGDAQGRNPLTGGKSTRAVPASSFVIFDLGSGEGWIQTGADAGRVHVDVDDANLRLQVLRR